MHLYTGVSRIFKTGPIEMNSEHNYLEINRESWNNRTDIHLKSEFYDLDNFIKGKTSLKRFELDLLGDLEGKTILHLQCHFGQDTISLTRLGAEVTGVCGTNRVDFVKELKVLNKLQKIPIQT